MAFVYPPKLFFILAGYDSLTCLPSETVFHSGWVRFACLLTLQNCFSIWQGTIRLFAYPPKLFFNLGGYDSLLFLPSKTVFRSDGVRFTALLTLQNCFSFWQGTIRSLAYPPKLFFDLAGYGSQLSSSSDQGTKARLQKRANKKNMNPVRIHVFSLVFSFNNHFLLQ
ncbi:hypothetical protein RKD52_003637 [Metabacillus sp. SLBN-84]